jgi:hypothetical protein
MLRIFCLADLFAGDNPQLIVSIPSVRENILFFMEK